MMTPDGQSADSEEALEVEPARRLVLRWRNELKPREPMVKRLITQGRSMRKWKEPYCPQTLDPVVQT